MNFIKQYFLVFVISFFLSGVAQATLVKPVNIQQLTALAKYIVKAQVTHGQTELDEYESGKYVTYYTLKPLEWIKGGKGNEPVIIKQLADGEFTAGNIAVRQTLYFPKYEVGQTYLFFLPYPHKTTGLLAPIGLFQGVFDVVKDENGREALPQLKERAGFLKKDLKKTPRAKFLKSQLGAVESNNSYESFKSVIEAAME